MDSNIAIAVAMVVVALIAVAAYVMTRPAQAPSNAGLIGGGIGSAVAGILGAAGVS